MDDEIQFEAIIKKVEGKLTVTGDKEYRIMLATENPLLIQAGAWPANQTVMVTMKQNRYHGLGDPSTL